MPVVPIVLGLGALWLFFSDNNPLSKNLANPAKAPAGAPGPGAQGLRAATGQGGVQQFQGPNYALGTNAGSPNSTLVTLNNGIVIANNAMGFADQLGQYFGSNE